MGLEQYSTQPPSSLDTGLRWFVTGLCYVHAKLPASVLQMVKPKGSPDVEVTTLLVEPELYVPSEFSFPLDNWQHTIQGIPVVDAIRLLSDLNSVRFRLNDGKVWMAAAREISISDPYAPIRVVKAIYLLPVAVDHRLVITKIINGQTAVIEKKPHGRTGRNV